VLLRSGAAVAVLGGQERELEEAHGLLCAALIRSYAGRKLSEWPSKWKTTFKTTQGPNLPGFDSWIAYVVRFRS